MNKKILAMALAIVFIATAFTACKSKLNMTEINGNEYPLVTDKDGETVVNKKNQIAVLVTDREGEVLTYADGEDQTYWLDLPENTVKGKDYSLVLGKGWVYKKAINGYGREGKENDIILTVAEFENQYGDLDSYMKETEKESEDYIEEIKKAFPNTEYTITDGTVTNKAIPCKIVEVKMKDAKNKIYYYGYLAHFIYNDRIITLQYACNNYSYEEIDALGLFNEAFIFE